MHAWLLAPSLSVTPCSLMPLGHTTYKTELQKHLLVESKLAGTVEAMRDLDVSQLAQDCLESGQSFCTVWHQSLSTYSSFVCCLVRGCAR